MRYRVWTRGPSKGGRALARALGGKKVGPNNPYQPISDAVIINWGDSQCPLHHALNPSSAISRMANKLTAFRVFRDANVPIPKFAETRDAVSWDGTVVVRHKLTGHSGEGIEIVEPGNELPNASLYVQYIPKNEEYRIHVGRKKVLDEFEPVPDEFEYKYEVIAEQRKGRRHDVADSNVNWKVRNHANGFVYVRQGFVTPPCVKQAAIDALRASGLDFGAVDIIYTKKGKAYVLEINTAPGLEGTTVEDYARWFRSPGVHG